MQFTHIDIQVTINEENRSWAHPSANETISFSIPSSLFDEKKLSTIIPAVVKVAEEKFILEKQKAELDKLSEVEA